MTSPPRHRRAVATAPLRALLAAALLGGLWLTSAAPLGAAAAEPESSTPPRYTNRLIESRNPYLLLHAHNPVDWYPWGPEAFAKAKEENKPIFLSVGYSTCYWCHVAERTLYSDPEIAEVMNAWFVNVKVDSEQRPDVDGVYMLARMILTRQGGWPNNVFLTPELKPFFAGSYFPPTSGDPTFPSFPTILGAIHDAWENNRDALYETAEALSSAMKMLQGELVRGDRAPVAAAAWRARARESIVERFDGEFGGISMPDNPFKFPVPPLLDLLLADYRLDGNDQTLAMLTQTLDAMALGGIRDHLGGGFHRYSTTRDWSVPHFEKMLYDNAQLLRLYAEAYQITGKPLYRQVAESVGDDLIGEMSAPDGGFYTAMDSQVDGREGASYLWTAEQIAAVLGPTRAAAFLETYALTGLPYYPGAAEPEDPEAGVVRVRGTTADADIAARLAAHADDRGALLAVRVERPQPARDDKIVVALNGLAIGGLARAGALLGRPDYLDQARRAADRLWRLAFDPGSGTLKHEIFHGVSQIDGYLADYALLGVGFMRLGEATGEAVWRRRAARLADGILARFRRPDGGLSTTAAQGDLLFDLEDIGDEIHPSGTSATVDLLLRLSKATGERRFAAAAGPLLGHLSGRIERLPDQWSSVIVAISEAPDALEIALAAAPGAEVADADPGAGSGAGAAAAAFPGTADYVTVSGTVRGERDAPEIALVLEIADGYHVNANPASREELIPTSAAFDGIRPSRIRYPPPRRFKPPWVDEGIDVYEGTVELVAEFPPGALDSVGTVHAAVTAQACNDRICLPPARLPVAVPLD